MLVSIADAIASMGLNAALTSSLTPALTKAIAKAEIRLSAELDTSLKKLDNVDTFFTNLDLFNGCTQDGMIRLRLSNSFVDEEFPIILETSPTWNGLYSELDSGQYKVNYELGIVYLDPSNDAQCVHVGYRSGFFDETDVDERVRLAILSFLPMTLQASQPQTDAAPAANTAFQFSGDLAQAMISGLNRVVGMAFRPMFYDRSTVLP